MKSVDVSEQRVFINRIDEVVADIVVICNILNSLIYLGFCGYELWTLETISFRSVSQLLSWVVVTALAFYCKEKVVRENKKWPFVLVTWWVFSGLFQLFSFIAFLIFYLKLAALPHFLQVSSGADLASSPFSAFICFGSLSMSSSRALHELQRPLVPMEDIDESSVLRESFSNAGILSRLTFRWLNPIFEIGRAQRLELPHIPSVPKSETAEAAYSFLQESVERQNSEFSPLLRAIFGAVWKPLVINGIFAGINTLASYLGPFLISNFVNFLSGEDSKPSYGYMLALLFFFGKMVESLSQRQWYFGGRQIGVRVRAALMASIYNKSLMIKYSSISNGKIINFLDVDVERISDFFLCIHGIWLLPVQIFLALIILQRNLGFSASISAVLTTFIVMVSNMPLVNSQERLHSKIMEAKDARIKATAETLKCMRILKLHSWENAYLDKLLKLRDAERRWLKRYLYTCSAIAFFFWASPTLVSAVAFGVCILVKAPLTPGTVLSALATFRILQEPIYNLPELMAMVTQTKVSIDRIQDFIKDDQKKINKKKKISNANCTKGVTNVAIEIEPGEYSWEPDSCSNKTKLKIDKRIKITRGQKVAICGSVGSGKSSFLCSILGEIPQVCGQQAKVSGSKAYVPQSAWIQTGTVRENVLFGKEMDRKVYEEVIKACALDRDIGLWVDGDMSLIGERGMNLSGGQKQRIQLARAAYSNSDVYLLDDPFSAVDAHTGAHLFKECLMRLLSCKTVIYATHQLEFLNAADLTR